MSLIDRKRTKNCSIILFFDYIPNKNEKLKIQKLTKAIKEDIEWGLYH